MESAGREKANGRRRLAVKDHVHQHQLDTRHPPRDACTHARPSDGNSGRFQVSCEGPDLCKATDLAEHTDALMSQAITQDGRIPFGLTHFHSRSAKHG